MRKILNLDELRRIQKQSKLLNSVVAFEKTVDKYVIEQKSGSNWMIYHVDDRGGDFNKRMFDSEEKAVSALLVTIANSYRSTGMYVADLELIDSLVLKKDGH